MSHWQVLKESWAAEKERAKKALPIEQKDFLPASLEIMETPASPAGRFTIYSILTFFSIAVLWAIFGRIDVVATAQGKMMLLGKTKVVQSLETGLVRKLLVENGQHVNKGDVLIELDATFAFADVERLRRDFQNSLVTEVRTRWLLEQWRARQERSAKPDVDEKQLTDTITQQVKNQYAELIFAADIPADIKDIQRLLARSQWQEFLAIQAATQQQQQEKHSEKKVAVATLNKLLDTLPLLKEQVDGVNKLSEDGVVRRFQQLEYQERYIAHRLDIGIARDQILQTQAAIRTVEKQSEQHQQEFQKQIVSELSDAMQKRLALEQELAKARRTNKLQTIRSPVDGVVQQLAINTVGGVVPAGEALMVVVPVHSNLQIEVSLLNKDAGFVHADQTVEVKLEAFPFTKYGVVHGRVLSIDRDAVQDENLGLVYPMRISIESNEVYRNGEAVELTPGMALTAEIKTGQRRIIEFLMSPLLRYKNESLRER